MNMVVTAPETITDRDRIVLERGADPVGERAGVLPTTARPDRRPGKKTEVGPVERSHRDVDDKAQSWDVASEHQEDLRVVAQVVQCHGHALVAPGAVELRPHAAALLACDPEERGVTDDGSERAPASITSDKESVP